MMICLPRFAIRDIAFNLVPENVFVAPFQRFQTSLVKETGMTGKVVAGMDVVQHGNEEAQFEGRPNVLGLQDPIIRGGGEAEFEGKVVDGANVLGLVAAAAALGTAAALRKEEGRLVVEVSSPNCSSTLSCSFLQICSSLASLVSLLLETALCYLCPPGLLSLVATQVLRIT